MRKSSAVALSILLAAAGSAPVFTQQRGALTGIAQSSGKGPLAHFRVHVRNASTGELAGATTSNQAGQFSFGSLQPFNYVVEIVDAAGKVVGLSPLISVAADATVTVTVGATAAGALAGATGGGLSRLGLGPLASVAVADATSTAEVTAVVATRDGKIVVCHKLSAAVSQTLEIKEAHRDSHIGHGDTLGACAASATAKAG